MLSCHDGPPYVLKCHSFRVCSIGLFRPPYASSSRTGRSWRNDSLQRTKFDLSMHLCAIRFEMILSLTSSFFVRERSPVTCPYFSIARLDQTPPRKELKVSDPKVRDLTLFQLLLAPSSVLLLSFQDVSLNGAFRMTTRTHFDASIARVDPNRRAPLLDSILAEAQDLPPPPTFDKPPPPKKSNPRQPSKGHGKSALPKWLKTGQSKLPIYNSQRPL